MLFRSKKRNDHLSGTVGNTGKRAERQAGEADEGILCEPALQQNGRQRGGDFGRSIAEGYGLNVWKL